MSDTPKSKKAVDRVALGAIAVILGFLYFFFVSLVVISFSFYVMRSEWDAELSKNTDNQIQSVDELIFLKNQSVEISAQIAISLKALSLTDDVFQAAQGELIEKQSDQLVAQRKLEGNLLVVQAHFARVIPALVGVDLGKLADIVDAPELSIEEATAGFHLLINGTYGPDVAPDRVDQIIKATRELATFHESLADSKRAADKDVSVAEGLKRKAERDVAGIETRLGGLRHRLGSIEARLPPFSEYRARLERIEKNFSFLNMHMMVKLPPILLTLIATIAAGGLGTLVAYSRTAFIDQKRPKVSELVITIGEGVAAAIGIFLFSGAGLLALSQSGGQDGLDLSPYMVAFLAFLSGLMAESAFGRITRYGQRIFGEDKSEEVTEKPPKPEPEEPLEENVKTPESRGS
ncbi:hypothetical protein [Shimia abyssi]|uniref:Uncharacterized protein n=1 Tax=Shimia abyssi TaxID=1662395 RepID=A0A2P8FIQ7_9RHOB|nr:hypothetical protein [Shimia abyssi]PSL21604.1 hypothetical protein CLV88_10127 [Shimia abyssi]